jgi:catalase
MTSTQPEPTTTDAGIPVASQEHSLTVGPDGPILLHDFYLIEQMANFNRERIPERQPHAKGFGAFGELEVTHDVGAYTKAAVFQPGTKTEMLARFSTVAGERGSPDTWRDVRGFSLKFYTSEGNFDIVGNNTPVFFVRDPLKFQHFIHSQKRRQDNGLRDNDMQWDFWTLSPESAHQVTYLMGDRGIPRTWRHMNGYGSHTYSWVNPAGEIFWVKYHFITDQGIEFLTDAEAAEITGRDADSHTRDLFTAIARGNYPSWTVKVQIMPFEEARTYRYSPFDLTKVWPHSDYPLIDVGKFTLNRNPTDHHTEIEQAAFEPNNMVPGTGLSPDKMLLARGFSYADAHRARLGVNYKEIPVNAAKVEVHAYSKDGAGRTRNVSDPVYWPNSKGGPTADASLTAEPLWHLDGDMIRAAYTPRRDDDDWGQAGTMVRNVLDDAARDRLVSNITGQLLNGVTEPVLERAFQYWKNVDQTLGDKVEKGVRAGQP